MPDDPVALEPLMELLIEQKCPLRLQERFYNFNKLQHSKAGREFLIKFNANFAKVDWAPFLFTKDQVREILAGIQTYPLSRLEHLEDSALVRLLTHDDQESDYDESNFFGINERWNLFPISSFGSYNLEILKLWFNQVKVFIADDDLLFYRLTFLSWFYRLSDDDFVESMRTLLEKSIDGNSYAFRASVLQYYYPKKRLIDKDHILEIPSFILKKNLIARAALHFEHLIAVFEMGHQVSFDKIAALFQEFKPSVVLPFLCRRLLEWLDYCNFRALLKEFSSSPSPILLEWKELYYNTCEEFSYFPSKFLPVEVQLKFWRRQVLCVDDVFEWDPPFISLNHPQFWKSDLELHDEQKAPMAIEKDGFTFFNCSGNQESIIAFVERRIIGFAAYNKPLPRIMPLLWKLCLVQGEEYGLFTKGGLVEDLCIINDDDEAQSKHDYGNASKLLDKIVSTVERWKMPILLFV